MNQKKSVLIAAAAAGGVVGVVVAHILEMETSLPTLASRLIGGVVGISFYYGGYAFLRSRQSN